MLTVKVRFENFKAEARMTALQFSMLLQIRSSNAWYDLSISCLRFLELAIDKAERPKFR